MNNNPSKREIPYAKKSFGQNFLVDTDYISRVIEAAELSRDDIVIEIGPGRGALTRELVKRAGQVIAVELDADLVPVLQQQFAADSNFELIQADILKLEISSITADKRSKLIANLPYYISTAVLQRMIEQRQHFAEMVLMFQREVVERIIAEPGNSERGYLSVLVEAFLNVEKLFDVPPSAFKPVPKVWSSVIRANSKDTFESIGGKEKQFERLVGASFRQKRKTISNNLKAAASELSIVDANVLLDRSNIDAKRRAETLTLEEWITLFANYVA